MSTAFAKSAPRIKREVKAPTKWDGRVLLAGISWETYASLCRDLDGQRIWMNYDRGQLEIVMPVSRVHERYGWFLSTFLEVLAEELGLPFDVGGSSTISRKDLARGLEPDDSYWITHAPEVKGKGNLDYSVVPPPDIVLESEVTHSLLDRLPILAALKVPEIWKCRGPAFVIGLLQQDGTYLWGEKSIQFPMISTHDIVPFLQRADTEAPMEIVRSFRKWVREHLVNARK